MNILGNGVDIVSNSRIKKSIKNDKFINRIYSINEINESKKIKNKANFFAKRFAAKEAFTKALGTGIGKGISLKDIEVFNDSSGKPNIKVRGLTNNFLKRKIKRNKYKIYLSLSDDDPWAQATVIISYN